jgi:RNA polymerase sigma-70 factor (ECF subfamily)
MNANAAPDGDVALCLVRPGQGPEAPGRGRDDERSAALRLDDPDREATTLMELVQRGDERAFAELFHLFSPTVLGVVRRVVRDPSQSEEVAQEVFVEVWRTATRFERERGSVAAFIATLAHRRAVDRVRSEQARTDRQEKVASFIPAVEPPAETRVLDVVETELVGRRVRNALATLTDLQREAIELSFYQGYTYPQVAQLLDVPLGTVKTRIRDGMIRLRDQLGVIA